MVILMFLDSWFVFLAALLVSCAVWYLHRCRKSSALDTDSVSEPRLRAVSLIAMLSGSNLLRAKGFPSESTRRSALYSEETKRVECALARVKQPYDAFLVLDVEGTCIPGSDYDWPNEIIEWPVCLMRWKDATVGGIATSSLEVVDEFRTFVKPVWRPKLSQFCTDLTGITQDQVNRAPVFTDVIPLFSDFLAKNGLIHARTGERLLRFCWCTDTACDIRDFVVKQCFISKIPMPAWIRGDVLDVRQAVRRWSVTPPSQHGHQGRIKLVPATSHRSMNIPSQLSALGLSSFVGRQHSGIDDTRNIARVLAELARIGVSLKPNTVIYPGRRWAWMGKSGEILEEYCVS